MTNNSPWASSAHVANPKSPATSNRAVIEDRIEKVLNDLANEIVSTCLDNGDNIPEGVNDALLTLTNCFVIQSYHLYSLTNLLRKTAQLANVPPDRETEIDRAIKQLIADCDNNIQVAIRRGKGYALEAGNTD